MVLIPVITGKLRVVSGAVLWSILINIDHYFYSSETYFLSSITFALTALVSGVFGLCEPEGNNYQRSKYRSK